MSMLHTVNRRKANWIGHISSRNCLLRHVIEGEIEGRIDVTGRRERRLSSYWMTLGKLGYWNLKEVALGRTVWRNRFEGGYGSIVKTKYGMNEQRYGSTAMDSWWDMLCVKAKLGLKQENNFLYCPSWVFSLSGSNTRKSLVVYFVCHSSPQ